MQQGKAMKISRNIELRQYLEKGDIHREQDGSFFYLAIGLNDGKIRMTYNFNIKIIRGR